MVKKFYIVSCAALVASLCFFPQDAGAGGGGGAAITSAAIMGFNGGGKRTGNLKGKKAKRRNPTKRAPKALDPNRRDRAYSARQSLLRMDRTQFGNHI